MPATWAGAIYPVLGALLYATFLQVPFTELTGAFRDVRFVAALLATNFAVVPLVVAALTAVVSLPQAVLLGVLLTLLTPCIDYVIVFCGLAGGDHQRLLAAAPLLMLAQMLALPALLWVFVGPELADIVEIGPFLEAFLVLIVLPLALALPDAYAITPVIVVTQTLVELIGMVVYVRVIPRLTPQNPRPPPGVS